MKALVAYFTASGVTKKVAQTLCEAVEGDLFEITPVTQYTKEDLDYTNPQSRCSVEMNDLSCRPAVTAKVENLDAYDTVFVGFPVWWGREPSVVDTFLDENCMCGKKVVVFCTSAGSPVDGSLKRITELTAGKAEAVCGTRVTFEATVEDLKKCVADLGL